MHGHTGTGAGRARRCGRADARRRHGRRGRNNVRFTGADPGRERAPEHRMAGHPGIGGRDRGPGHPAGPAQGPAGRRAQPHARCVRQQFQQLRAESAYLDPRFRRPFGVRCARRARDRRRHPRDPARRPGPDRQHRSRRGRAPRSAARPVFRALRQRHGRRGRYHHHHARRRAGRSRRTDRRQLRLQPGRSRQRAHTTTGAMRSPPHVWRSTATANTAIFRSNSSPASSSATLGPPAGCAW